MIQQLSESCQRKIHSFLFPGDTTIERRLMILNSNHMGKQSFVLPGKPVICAWASVAGKKESQGPLAKEFDITCQDSYFGQKTWEQGEKQMQSLALETLLKKAGITQEEIGMVCSGDLLNQCIGSSFPLRNKGIPHLGLYGACSTMAESLLTASMAVEGGFYDNDLLPLRLLRAAVSLPSWLRRATNAHRSMDRDRLRCCIGLQRRFRPKN